MGKCFVTGQKRGGGGLTPTVTFHTVAGFDYTLARVTLPGFTSAMDLQGENGAVFSISGLSGDLQFNLSNKRGSEPGYDSDFVTCVYYAKIGTYPNGEDVGNSRNEAVYVTRPVADGDEYYVELCVEEI